MPPEALFFVVETNDLSLSFEITSLDVFEGAVTFTIVWRIFTTEIEKLVWGWNVYSRKFRKFSSGLCGFGFLTNRKSDFQTNYIVLNTIDNVPFLSLKMCRSFATNVLCIIQVCHRNSRTACSWELYDCIPERSHLAPKDAQCGLAQEVLSANR